MIFFHIALAPDWRSAQTDGEYRISTRGLSVAEVGYMHGSFTHQILPVAEAFYGDLGLASTGEDALFLLEIDTDLLPASDLVRVEPVPGAADDFPHLYGPLPVSAVTAVHPLVRDETTGRFVLPPAIGQGPTGPTRRSPSSPSANLRPGCSR